MIELIQTYGDSVSVFSNGKFIGSIVTIEHGGIRQMYAVPNCRGVEHIIECSSAREGAAMIVMGMP